MWSFLILFADQANNSSNVLMTAVAGDNLRTTVSLEQLSGVVFEGQIKPLDGVPLQVMYQLDPNPTCGLLPLEVVKQRRTMGLSCGSDVGCIYGRCTIYDLGVSQKVVFSVGPLDAVGQRQLVLQSLRVVSTASVL